MSLSLSLSLSLYIGTSFEFPIASTYLPLSCKGKNISNNSSSSKWSSNIPHLFSPTQAFSTFTSLTFSVTAIRTLNPIPSKTKLLPYILPRCRQQLLSIESSLCNNVALNSWPIIWLHLINSKYYLPIVMHYCFTAIAVLWFTSKTEISQFLKPVK